jgi:hypothetical protein
VTNPGDCAFPCGTDTTDSGLTVREYIATQICSALCANPGFSTLSTDEQVAWVAVQQADALIAALNQQP